MKQQEILQQIETYKRADGSYDIRRMEQAFGIQHTIDDTFNEMFNGKKRGDSDPRVALAVEINGRLYDEEKAADKLATQAALIRALADDGSESDWHLLVKRGLAVAEYNDPESNASTGAHLRGWKDIDGNIYSDQAGLEENPGRL